jgi:hypothetical protein
MQSSAHFPTDHLEPGAEYQRRLESLRVAETQYKKRDTLLGSAKAILLLAGLVLVNALDLMRSIGLDV